MTIENTEPLLTPHQVAAMFRVDPKTVTRWASSGRIGFIRTPGGHRRFRETEVRALLAELTVPAATADRLTGSPRGQAVGNSRFAVDDTSGTRPASPGDSSGRTHATARTPPPR